MKIFKNNKLVYTHINGIKHLITNYDSVSPPDEIHITGVSINNKISSLTVNTTYQISVDVTPKNATNKTLIYDSSNPSVATVSKTGLIHAISVGTCTISVKSSNNISDLINIDIVNENVNPPTKIDINEIPYLSKYYTEPVVYTNEDFIQEIYVTDYYQKEYLQGNEFAENFTLKYWIDDNLVGENNVKSGNNFVNLGKISKGEHWISFQAIDSNDRKSRKSFTNIRCIEKGVDDCILENEIFSPSLTYLQEQYGIYTIKEKATETTLGFNSLFEYVKTTNYKKIIIPNATFYIIFTSELSVETPMNCVFIDNANNIEIDFSYSTLKLEPTPYSGEMFILNRCDNVHVANLNFIGDLDERTANLSLYPFTERCHAIGMIACKYCTLKNMDIRKIVGYGTIGGDGANRKDYFKNPEYNNLPARRDGFWIPSKMDIGNINMHTGEFEESTSRVSSTEFVPLRATQSIYTNDYDLTKHCLLGLGKWGYGKGGVVSNESCVYFAHFYDENYNYIETIPAYIYSKIKFSKLARYAKFTFIANKVEDVQHTMLTFTDTAIMENCKYINIHHERVRCVGTAFTAMYNILVDNCTYTDCGWAEAKCAWDCEDGWQAMQDLTIRNSKFIPTDKSVQQNPYLNCSGSNFIAENNTNMGAFQYDACRSFVYRNNTFTRGFEVRKGSNYFRSYNNLFIASILDKYANGKDIVHRNETINYDLATLGGQALGSQFNTEPYVIKYIDTTLNVLGTHDQEFYNCNFVNLVWFNGYINGTIKCYNCEFTGLNNGAFSLSFNSIDKNRLFKNCIFNSTCTLREHNNFNSGIWDTCNFKEQVTINPKKPNIMGQIKFNNCIFDKKIIVNIPTGGAYVQFNDCEFKDTISYQGIASSMCEFNRCIGN